MQRRPDRQKELSEQAMTRLLADRERRDFIGPKVMLVVLAAIAIATVLVGSKVF